MTAQMLAVRWLLACTTKVAPFTAQRCGAFSAPVRWPTVRVPLASSFTAASWR